MMAAELEKWHTYYKECVSALEGGDGRLTAWIRARKAENEKEKAICCLTRVFIIFLFLYPEWGVGLRRDSQPGGK